MKKAYLFTVIISFLSFSINAQKLLFNENGTFKIAQFTDTHYQYGNPKSDTTLLLIERVLDAEKPDLVVFTGDIVTSKQVKESWDMITKLSIDRQIPFAVTLGNHDDEQGLTRSSLAYLITEYPYNINRVVEDGSQATLNNVVAVYGSNRNMEIKSTIYLIDSNMYSTISGVGGWGWITTETIEWYKRQSLKFTINNNLQPIPSVAFFHIPLPEYRAAFNDEKNIRYGVRLEKECAPELNSGMFLAMKEMRDVMGVFTGHDHVNDYIVDYYDIALAYGCFSGWKTTYTPEINGARIVELKEGEREFNTWIHLLDGTVKQKVTYPQDFKKEE